MIFNCSPWIENPYMDAIERNALGGLSLDAFLSKVHKSFLSLSIISLPFVLLNNVCRKAVGFYG
jgi:hypothetical protein